MTINRCLRVEIYALEPDYCQTNSDRNKKKTIVEMDLTNHGLKQVRFVIGVFTLIKLYNSSEDTGNGFSLNSQPNFKHDLST